MHGARIAPETVKQIIKQYMPLLAEIHPWVHKKLRVR